MTWINLEWKWIKAAGKFQATTGDYRAEIQQNYGANTWNVKLYLNDQLLADLPTTSATAGKEIIAERLTKIKRITLWDEL